MLALHITTGVFVLEGLEDCLRKSIFFFISNVVASSSAFSSSLAKISYSLLALSNSLSNLDNGSNGTWLLIGSFIVILVEICLPLSLGLLTLVLSWIIGCSTIFLGTLTIFMASKDNNYLLNWSDLIWACLISTSFSFSLSFLIENYSWILFSNLDTSSKMSSKSMRVVLDSEVSTKNSCCSPLGLSGLPKREIPRVGGSPLPSKPRVVLLDLLFSP